MEGEVSSKLMNYTFAYTSQNSEFALIPSDHNL